jgi:hypothetical protein
MNKPSIPIIVVVLNLNPQPISALVVRSTTIVNAMEASGKMFPAPSPAYAVARSDISALDLAEVATKTRTTGSVAVRDDKRKVVVADMHQLHSYVQQLANANPEQAELIAQGAAMTLRKKPSRHKSDLSVKHVVSGTVTVIAKAVLGGHAHEWQYSTDGKTWTSVAASLKASTTITGLQTGVLTYFRHRAITKVGPDEWSQPVSALVS